MKRTDLERKERDIKRAMKKEERLAKGGSSNKSVGDFINELSSYFFHDENKIYNISVDERIPDLLEEMMMDMEEKQWENIIRKAVRKTGIKEKESAIKELLDFIQ
ncbi:MAG: hypothetical protein PQJ61_12425 [Spirochaetales bacterium]|uniref:Uncharacterized protein n=1 Tax=Candidatus Thalassospirochaeta sargassi TaxID=3119039 RepID=A0AAJ1IGL0_9SPIO|nr:hypothetical protein [Spirochaetales bacterium]